MPVPNNVPAELQSYLEELETRVSLLESPQGYLPAFLTTSTNLSAAGARLSGARWAIVTDLKTVAWSDGSHWYRTDTGAVIV